MIAWGIAASRQEKAGDPRGSPARVDPTRRSVAERVDDQARRDLDQQIAVVHRADPAVADGGRAQVVRLVVVDVVPRLDVLPVDAVAALPLVLVPAEVQAVVVAAVEAVDVAVDHGRTFAYDDGRAAVGFVHDDGRTAIVVADDMSLLALVVALALAVAALVGEHRRCGDGGQQRREYQDGLVHLCTPVTM